MNKYFTIDWDGTSHINYVGTATILFTIDQILVQSKGIWDSFEDRPTFGGSHS